MKIFFVEFAHEAKFLIAHYGRDILTSKDNLIICLDPGVRAYLKAEHIPAEGTERYFINESHCRIVLLTNQTVTNLLEQFHFIDYLGVGASYRNLLSFHLRFYFNHIYWILEIFSNVERLHAGSVWYSCISSKSLEECIGDDPLIQPYESFLGILLKDFASSKKIEYEVLPHIYPQPSMVNRALGRMVHSIAKLLANVHLAAFTKTSSINRSVIVPTFSYRMGHLIEEMKSKYKFKCYIVCEDKKNLKRGIKKILEILNDFRRRLFKKAAFNEATVYLDLLSIKEEKITRDRRNLENSINNVLNILPKNSINHGVDFTKYILPKIQRGACQQLYLLLEKAPAINYLYETLKPDLLMAMYSVGIYDYMGELSRQKKFASLNISHGTYVPYHNEYEKIENYELAKGVILNTYEHVAVQTPWTERFLNVYQDRRSRILSGPLIFAQVHKSDADKMKKQFPKLNEFKKTITHATTLKVRFGFRFYIAETLDEYISSLTDLVNAVNEMEDTALIIRPHPGNQLSSEELLRLLPESNKIILIETGTFSEVLSVTDMLVSYSSTCIEEALQNQIPVLLFDKWKRYNHFDCDEIEDSSHFDRRPVYYLSKPERLSSTLDQILKVFSNPLSPEELKDHCYPTEYKRHFYQFTDHILK